MREPAIRESICDEVGFDEKEPPTRRSDVNLVDYAREAEALLAHGLDIDSAQMLRATRPPPGAEDDSSAPDAAGSCIALDRELRLAASSEEIEWFPLGDAESAILRALERPMSVREALERADLPVQEGVEHVRTLIEIGLIALPR